MKILLSSFFTFLILHRSNCQVIFSDLYNWRTSSDSIIWNHLPDSIFIPFQNKWRINDYEKNYKCLLNPNVFVSLNFATNDTLSKPDKNKKRIELHSDFNSRFHSEYIESYCNDKNFYMCDSLFKEKKIRELIIKNTNEDGYILYHVIFDSIVLFSCPMNLDFCLNGIASYKYFNFSFPCKLSKETYEFYPDYDLLKSKLKNNLSSFIYDYKIILFKDDILFKDFEINIIKDQGEKLDISRKTFWKEFKIKLDTQILKF